MQTVYDQEREETYWDFKITDGKLDVIDHTLSEEQRAIAAVFLQRGTVPQMPAVGNQWAEALCGQIMPQELNAQIYDSISSLTGGIRFAPKYSQKDGKLFVEVKKI